ncbi:hypothetical protein WMY93_024824 [Mugilogobius chulae]|uniref:Uncharacterized protein n=1 Tax=Mugilogobius chulae TaxID=88201 RepID=A0AAW0N692_9GOBI
MDEISYEDSDEEYSPFPTTAPTTSSGRGTKRSRPSEPEEAPQPKRRTRSKKQGPAVNLGPEDAERVAELQAERRKFEEDRIKSLNLQQAQNVLQRVLDRDPGVIFDVQLESGPAPRGIPVQKQPKWCSWSCGMTSVHRVMILNQGKTIDNFAMLPIDSMYLGSMAHLELVTEWSYQAVWCGK